MNVVSNECKGATRLRVDCRCANVLPVDERDYKDDEGATSVVAGGW